MYQNIKIAALDFLYADSSVLTAREQLQQSVLIKQINNNKQLLVDVSVIIRADARTGIQRVVRALLKQLLDNPPAGYEVRPVFASAEHNYHYAPESFSLQQDRKIKIPVASNCVTVAAADVFLGLDLAAHVLPKHQRQLECWKRKGVKIHVVVYDLLPVIHPEWFHSKTTRNFYRWLRSVAILCDSAICISKTVKTDLENWLIHKYSFGVNTLSIDVIPMGCDIQASLPSKGLPVNAGKLLDKFKVRKTVLMVGTLEPRKGYDQVLDAFERLWGNGSDINLVIVGKSGWKTEGLLVRLHNHPMLFEKLYWLNKVTDEFLEKIYSACHGLIIASEGEGFGLPLIEAIRHGKPILARNLPVFREIDCENLSFFEAAKNQQEDFVESIYAWLAKEQLILNSGINLSVTWGDSAVILLKKIIGS